MFAHDDGATYEPAYSVQRGQIAAASDEAMDLRINAYS